MEVFNILNWLKLSINQHGGLESANERFGYIADIYKTMFIGGPTYRSTLFFLPHQKRETAISQLISQSLTLFLNCGAVINSKTQLFGANNKTFLGLYMSAMQPNLAATDYRTPCWYLWSVSQGQGAPSPWNTKLCSPHLCELSVKIFLSLNLSNLPITDNVAQSSKSLLCPVWLEAYCNGLLCTLSQQRYNTVWETSGKVLYCDLFIGQPGQT